MRVAPNADPRRGRRRAHPAAPTPPPGRWCAPCPPWSAAPRQTLARQAQQGRPVTPQEPPAPSPSRPSGSSRARASAPRPTSVPARSTASSTGPPAPWRPPPAGGPLPTRCAGSAAPAAAPPPTPSRSARRSAMVLETLERSAPPPPAQPAEGVGGRLRPAPAAVSSRGSAARRRTSLRHAAALRPFRARRVRLRAGGAHRSPHPAANELLSSAAPRPLQADPPGAGRRRRGPGRARPPPISNGCLHHKERAHDMGPRRREDLGLLLRALRPAPVAVRRLAARLRPDRARLLPVAYLGAGAGEVDPGAAAVLLHADGLLAGHLPPRHPAAAAGPAAQPVPADPAPLPPAGQPLDAGGDPARGQPQPAERPGTRPGGPAGDRPAAARSGPPRARWRRCGRGGTGRPSPTWPACCSAARPWSAR